MRSTRIGLRNSSLLKGGSTYAIFADFRAAIQRLLTNLAPYTDELATLMTENFPLFGKNRIRQTLFRSL